MDFLFVILIVVIIALVMPKPDEVANTDGKLIIKKKQCPPHQWLWQEIIDQHGVKHGERLICKVCGPLQGQSGREE